MHFLNFGSLNIDHVYSVDHLVRPGETITSLAYKVHAGGKGANQSMALARAGAPTAHAGRIGPEGRWLLDKLAAEGVDVSGVIVGRTPTGHAIIEVDAAGQNSIILFPGANKDLTKLEIDKALATAATASRDGIPAQTPNPKPQTLSSGGANHSGGAALLVQNETNHVPHLIKTAHELGMKVCFNPAPFGPEVRSYPLDLVDLLIFNESEGAGLAAPAPAPGSGSPEEVLSSLAARLPRAELVLTLGDQGAVYAHGAERIAAPAVKVTAMDTTAAGDTFIGYYLAAWGRGLPIRERLELACRAAALCVTKPGAMDSIPKLVEVQAMA